ncbi:exonuclease [Segatella baroniae F0067]|uniref:Exonuclease n=1 Tax=Segatella baroniae F0067 TaxID=1115809 RepID=U2NQL0_9BACT|nr:exonuclease domain-containing protein [Segatella baroniae]ERK40335.1 exonuclease [Segatella baroniae F0067]
MDILIGLFIMLMVVVLIFKAASKKTKESQTQQTVQLQFNCKRCSPNNDLVRIDSEGDYYVALLKNSKLNKTLTIKEQFIFELEKSVETTFEEWMAEEIALDAQQPSRIKDITPVNFIAIDFETATADRMACQIGITIVEEGVIKDTVVKLIQPPGNNYDSNTIAIHHITPNNTADAPTFDKVWTEISHYFVDSTIVAHNAAFDEDVLRRNLDFYKISSENIKPFECTYRIFNLSLEDLCDAFLMNIEGHHDAGFDSKCCAQFYLNYLNGISPGLVTPSKSKQKRTKNNLAITEDLSGRKISSETLKPLEAQDVENPNTPFFQQKIVITGTFDAFPHRDDLGIVLQKYGADINISISRKTNIVIIGEDAGLKKLEKIEMLQEQGYDIKTYSEDELLAEFDKFNISY